MSLSIARDQVSQLACPVSAGPFKRSKTCDSGDVEDADLRPRKRALTASPERPEREP